MTQERLCSLLKSTGYPVAHIEFKKIPTVPYIAYIIDGEEQRGADYENLICDRSFRIELYTEYSNTQPEKKLDNILSFVQFQKDRVKITDENLMMIVYRFDDVSRI